MTTTTLPVLRVATGSTGQVLLVPVSARLGGVAFDPSALAVSSALVCGDGVPVSGDWGTSAWDVDASTSPTTYRVAHTLGSRTRGTYVWWVRISAATGPVELPAALIEVR